jgi:hypothetical protein
MITFRSVAIQFIAISIILGLTACLPRTSLETDEPPSQMETTPTQVSPHPAVSTFYIRPDGGTAEQCTGLVDSPYPGAGSNKPCAWNHPFQALPPGGMPRIVAGDTLIIDSGSYMMGYGSPGAENCDYQASYDCTMPPIPSGVDSTHPTRIFGAGWDTGCSQPPELWGSGRSWYVLNLDGSSNVELGCLEITDHSSCIEDHLSPTGGSEYTCQREHPPYGDWASTGLFAQDSANVHLENLYIHGLANTGIQAGRLTDWTSENVRLIGNGWVGWDGDLVGDGSNSENHGTFIFYNWDVEWNGCGETYPDKAHLACWGQEAGGYGDGVAFGGTTGGHYIIEDSQFLHNTSDGLDMLYTRLPDTVIEIRRTIAEGNAGNQIKTTGAVSIENSIIVSNCGFFHDMPFWNNDDDCRANGDALALALQPGGYASLINSTVTGQGNCLITVECALDQTCNGSEHVRLQNNIFQGQKLFWSPQDDNCFAWYDDESSPPMPANPFWVSYTLIYGVRFGNVDPCPGEQNLCGVPLGLMSSSINAFDARLRSDSPAINASLADLAPAVDFTGSPRDSLPDIGAYER